MGRVVGGDKAHEGVVEPQAAHGGGDEHDRVGQEEDAGLVRPELAGDDHVHGEDRARGEELDGEGDGAAAQDLLEIGVGVA